MIGGRGEDGIGLSHRSTTSAVEGTSKVVIKGEPAIESSIKRSVTPITPLRNRTVSTPLDIPGSSNTELTYFPIEQFAESPHDPNALSTFYSRVKLAATSVMQNVLPGGGSTSHKDDRSNSSSVQSSPNMAPTIGITTSGLSYLPQSVVPKAAATIGTTTGTTMVNGIGGGGIGSAITDSNVNTSNTSPSISLSVPHITRNGSVSPHSNATTTNIASGHIKGSPSTTSLSPLRYLQNPWTSQSDMHSGLILSHRAEPSISNVVIGDDMDRFKNERDTPFSKQSIELSRTPSTNTMYSYNPRSHLPGYALEQDDVSDTESIASSNRDYIISQLSKRIEPLSSGGLDREFWMKDENASECFRCGNNFTSK